MRGFLFVTFAIFSASQSVFAHYHMLIPDRHSIKNGDKITLVYQFGHPLERELFNVAAPESATVIAPDGKATDVTKQLVKFEIPLEKEMTAIAYKLEWTAPSRGDFIFLFKLAIEYSDEEKTATEDLVQVVIHVDTQNGWDRFPTTVDLKSPIRPLTRPYAVLSNMAFQVEVQWPDKHANTTIEYERYSERVPKELPPDEYRTFTAKTGENGVAVVSFPEPGWWSVTAVKKYPKDAERTVEYKGKTFKLESRATMWVPVEAKVPLKPPE
jgi:uncharacterized GH25 family protein